MYSCLLDASKAFDNVHFGIIFYILNRKVLYYTIINV